MGRGGEVAFLVEPRGKKGFLRGAIWPCLTFRRGSMRRGAVNFFFLWKKRLSVSVANAELQFLQPRLPLAREKHDLGIEAVLVPGPKVQFLHPNQAVLHLGCGPPPFTSYTSLFPPLFQ